MECAFKFEVKNMKIKIKKLHPNSIIPFYAKPGDAGMDLTAIEMAMDEDNIVYKIGIALEIPEGYCGLIFPRSSNSKKDLLLCNSVGVVDSAYRGEFIVKFKRLYKYHLEEKMYSVGDKVAQLVIMPVPYVTFEESDTLSETDRGKGGFGSTGE